MGTRNLINYLKEYSLDIWPIENLYSVGQFTYIIRGQGDFELANALDNWKAKMEARVAEEWEITCHHPTDFQYNHFNNPNRFSCSACGEKDIIFYVVDAETTES